MNYLRILQFNTIILCFLVLTGCETIHTGILGDIPTGMKPMGMMAKGELYKDPKGRFTAIIPDSRNLVPKRQKEGVTFVGKDLDRGDLVYGVLAYPTPDQALSDQDVLAATFNGIQHMLEQKGYSLEIIHKAFSDHQGYPAMDVYYDIISGEFSRQLYVARFVKVNENVFNMYFLNANAFAVARRKAFSKKHIEYYSLPYAEKLFEGVTFILQ